MSPLLSYNVPLHLVPRRADFYVALRHLAFLAGFSGLSALGVVDQWGGHAPVRAVTVGLRIPGLQLLLNTTAGKDLTLLQPEAKQYSSADTYVAVTPLYYCPLYSRLALTYFQRQHNDGEGVLCDMW